MESPFDECNTVILYLEPILNTYCQQYMNILTLNTIPNGPLRELVFPISPEKLSPFQTWGSSLSCLFVLSRYKNTKPSMNNINTFMYDNDIPSVISYLRSHGYIIDTSITNLLNNSNTFPSNNGNNGGKRKMICVFSLG